MVTGKRLTLLVGGGFVLSWLGGGFITTVDFRHSRAELGVDLFQLALDLFQFGDGVGVRTLSASAAGRRADRRWCRW